MHSIVYALYKPDKLERRMRVLQAHRDYLHSAPAKTGVRVLISGPLCEDDGERFKGSFFLLEVDSRTGVEGLFSKDPLAMADV